MVDEIIFKIVFLVTNEGFSLPLYIDIMKIDTNNVHCVVVDNISLFI